MHFQTQLVGNNACYVQYTRATNTVQLINDAGTGYVGSGGTLGGAGTLSNGQCTLNLGSSSTSGSGNNLTVNLALIFTPAFNGAKTVSMNVNNNETVSSGWQAKGTWTVPASLTISISAPVNASKISGNTVVSATASA